ncbi:hypothetical protein [Planococcus koreensis]|uniref:hypothetical protein n=1 Tax=Planococcus koreensis TaxID=112331 RepID=UPI0039FC8040
MELTAYTGLLRSSDFWESLVLTTRVAGLSSIIAAILGGIIAISLFMLSESAKSEAPRFWHRLFQLPLTIPHLVGGYIIVLLFMQSGFLSKILATAGVIDKISDFPVLVNDPFGWASSWHMPGKRLLLCR